MLRSFHDFSRTNPALKMRLSTRCTLSLIIDALMRQNRSKPATPSIANRFTDLNSMQFESVSGLQLSGIAGISDDSSTNLMPAAVFRKYSSLSFSKYGEGYAKKQ